MKAVGSKKHKVLMIQMNEQEALATIASLASQLSNKNPNSNRFEKFLEGSFPASWDGLDFSIAVMPEVKKDGSNKP